MLWVGVDKEDEALWSNVNEEYNVPQGRATRRTRRWGASVDENDNVPGGWATRRTRCWGPGDEEE